MSALALKNGQTVTGVVLARTAETWEVQTPQERVSLPAGEIDRHQELEISLMPEGQLDVLKSDEVRDLVAYLMSPRQVPLELAPLAPAEKPAP